jgi:hypothetical protein
VKARLHGDADPMSLTGRVLVTAEIASQLGVTEIDERSPRALRMSET